MANVTFCSDSEKILLYSKNRKNAAKIKFLRLVLGISLNSGLTNYCYD